MEEAGHRQNALWDSSGLLLRLFFLGQSQPIKGLAQSGTFLSELYSHDVR